MIVLRNGQGNQCASIAGDALDLKALHKAVLRYCDLYFSSANPLLKGQEIDAEENLMLTLAYHLRKAYTGNRDHLYANINENALTEQAKDIVNRSLAKKADDEATEAIDRMFEDLESDDRMDEGLFYTEEKGSHAIVDKTVMHEDLTYKKGDEDMELSMCGVSKIDETDPHRNADYDFWKKICTAAETGNLYYSFRMDYAWLIWTLFELQRMISAPITKDMFEEGKTLVPERFRTAEYTMTKIRRDQAVTNNFVAACWHHIADWLGESWMQDLVFAASLSCKDVYRDNLYAQALGAWYVTNGTTQQEKKDQLAVIIWMLMDKTIDDDALQLMHYPVSERELKQAIDPNIKKLMAALKGEGRMCPTKTSWNTKFSRHYLNLNFQSQATKGASAETPG